MKNKVLIILVVVVILIATGSLIYAGTVLNGKKTTEDSHLIELTFSELQEKIDNEESFILLIARTDCSHCIEYKPILKKVLAEYDLIAYEIDLDKINDEQMSKLNNIANTGGRTPNTVFIENGKEKNTSQRLAGAVSESKLVNRLKALGYIKE